MTSDPKSGKRIFAKSNTNPLLGFLLLEHPMILVFLVCLAVWCVEVFFVVGYSRYALRDVPNTFYGTVEVWVRHGFFKQFGLWSGVPFDASALSSAPIGTHRSFAPGYIWPIFALQKIVYALTGRTINCLYSFYASVFPILTGCLIASLFILRATGLQRRSRTLLACVFAVNYMTNHFASQAFNQLVNLETTFLAGVTAFIYLLDWKGSRGEAWPTWTWWTAGLFFGYMTSSETMLFVAAFCLLEIATYHADRPINWRPFFSFILGVVCAAGVFTIQLLAARHRYPWLFLSGSELKARAGLDGSAQFYRTWIDVVQGGVGGIGKRFRNSAWPVEAVMGLIGFLLCLPQSVRALEHRRFTLGAYASFLIVVYIIHVAFLAQMVVIHPYFFDAFIATPCYVFAFLLLPEWLCSQSQTLGKNLSAEVLETSIVLVFCLIGLVLFGDNLRKLALTFPSHRG